MAQSNDIAGIGQEFRKGNRGFS